MRLTTQRVTAGERRSPAIEAGSAGAVWAAALLCALAFMVDLLTPRGMGDGPLYSIALLAYLWGPHSPRLPLWTAAAATGLMAAGHLLSPAGPEPAVALYNRTLAAGVVWAIAIVINHRAEAERRLRRVAFEAQAAELSARAADRQIGEIVQGMSDCFLLLDAQWRITYCNRQAERYFGRAAETLLGRSLWEAFPQLRGTASETHHRRAAAEQKPAHFETRSPITGRWVESHLYPSREGVSVFFRDISERKRAEEHRELLLAELAHRVKNTLAVVQALASQTLRRSQSLEEFHETFAGRLSSLAAAHTLLLAENWQSVLLEELLLSALEGHMSAGRVQLERGPSVRLSANAALSVGMAIHELTTNATKHGALSRPAGQVRVAWRVSIGTPATVGIHWLERGGPPVGPPEYRGFGSRLLAQLGRELGATVDFQWHREGLECRIVLPVGEHVSIAQPADSAEGPPPAAAAPSSPATAAPR